MIKKIKIGNTQIPNNIFCAPLAGYTDFAMRKICYKFGAGLCFTEMVSAKGLKYNNDATRALLYKHESEPLTVAQIFGCDPEIMRSACESEDLKNFSTVDINMGCPVPKVFKNGEGSALLENIPLAEKIISECKKSGKNITVKFRIGVTAQKIVGVEFAKACENAGADLITVHGRTRDKYYSGDVDFIEIEKIKNAVKIPVIANGGIFSKSDAQNMIDKTGADGVMIARAALYNPHVFAQIVKDESEWDIRSTIEEQIKDMLAFYGERFTVVQMRKMTSFYIKGMRNCAQYKNKLFSCNTISELNEVINEIFN